MEVVLDLLTQEVKYKVVCKIQRLSHIYFKLSETFKLWEDFIRWVKLFYHDAKSCVSNNGNMSKFFPIRRGVRQGCLLSTYLFILCIELLSHKISTTEDIKDIFSTKLN